MTQRRTVTRNGVPLGRGSFEPKTLNVIGSDGKKMGEVRFSRCNSCYSLVHPLDTEQHEKYCVR